MVLEASRLGCSQAGVCLDCPHASGRRFTSYSPQISEADLSSKLQSLPYSNILMVEVENIHHEQFTVNEEVKVEKPLWKRQR